MMLRPIDSQSLDDALPLLARGFPAAPASFWAAGLNRLKHHCATAPVAPAGYMLHASGRDVGVLLTIPSERKSGQAVRSVINLSSWYVDQEHRWRAPRMLQQIAADDATLYSDLTPTAPVQPVIERLGFQRDTDGALIFVLPWTALQKSSGAQVVPLDRLPQNSIAAPVLRMMTDHAAWECLCCALWDGEILHPLMFSRTSRKGIPIARLIYAENISAVLNSIAAVSRYLMLKKMMLLAVCGDRRERLPGSFFTRRASPTFFKGKIKPSGIDHAYSEFVFLQI